MPATIAAVVPTLEEERTIGPTVSRLVAIADQVVVADGGSSDRTREIASAHGAQVVSGARGRGAQLNLGARSTACDLLLFVHADTSVAPEARQALATAYDRGLVGGAFRIRFDGRGWRYRLGGTIATLRSRLSGLSFGDQAQFVRSDVFWELGGFREWPLLEDYDFSRRLARRGRVAILTPAVVTSARRFAARGPLRTVLGNWLILIRFALGATPEALARRYRNVR